MSSRVIATPKKGAVSPARTGESPTPQARRAATRKKSSAPGGKLVNRVTGVKQDDRHAMLAHIRAGLPASVIKSLEEAYGATQADIANCLLIPLSTLRRRLKNAERLTIDESDRVVRLARIRDLTLEMMQGDEAATIHWLRTPRDILGNESPMEHASTDLGAREVEDLIGRLRHGVFS